MGDSEGFPIFYGRVWRDNYSVKKAHFLYLCAFKKPHHYGQS